MESLKFPWWVGFPASFGFTVMGIVAPTFLPVWVQAVLFAAGGGAVLWSVFAGAWHYRRQRAPLRETAASFPAPHKGVVQSLAEPLSRLEHIALDRGRADFAAFTEAKEAAQRLIGRIPYDPSTVQTVRDFIQACSIVLDATQHGEDGREARNDVSRISPALFRFLHEGRSVERDKVNLPGWCRTPEPTFDQGWEEATSGWIPFVRLRDFAPAWGVPLPRIGPGQNNTYYLEGALRQAAVRGKLRVEGRQYRGPVRHNDPLVPIPPEHFRDYGFGHGVLNYDEPNEASHTGDVRMMTLGQRGKQDVTFYDLHLSNDDARKVIKDFAKDQRIERP